MKKLTLIFALLVNYIISAQHSIAGSFSSTNEYTWIIAYKLKPGTQNYIADTEIKNGAFNLTMPENAPAGMYRLTYAVPQQKFYFDVIYNGKEDIVLTVNESNEAKFISSKENILYNEHAKAIDSIEQKIFDLYLSNENNKKEFSILSEKLQKTQKLYEEKSEGLIAHEFITANILPIPNQYVNPKEYLAYKKTHFFKGIDMNNPILLASTFLTTKISNYVFTALPLEIISNEENEKEIINNIMLVNTLIEENSPEFRLHVLYSLWSQAALSHLNLVSDLVYHSYLKKLATLTNHQNIIDQIDIHNRLRLGAIAPEIEWNEADDKKTLSGLTGAENYILIFWSSNCSHCLKELPKLQNYLKGNTRVKAIAVGLENVKISWEIESAKLSDFNHAIALGKWESDYAKLYDINATPSYFILNKEKRIIAKPKNYEVILEFLKNETTP